MRFDHRIGNLFFFLANLLLDFLINMRVVVHRKDGGTWLVLAFVAKSKLLIEDGVAGVPPDEFSSTTESESWLLQSLLGYP